VKSAQDASCRDPSRHVMYYLASEFNPYLGSLIRTMKTLSGLMPRQIMC